MLETLERGGRVKSWPRKTERPDERVKDEVRGSGPKGSVAISAGW